MEPPPHRRGDPHRTFVGIPHRAVVEIPTNCCLDTPPTLPPEIVTAVRSSSSPFVDLSVPVARFPLSLKLLIPCSCCHKLAVRVVVPIILTFHADGERLSGEDPSLSFSFSRLPTQAQGSTASRRQHCDSRRLVACGHAGQHRHSCSFTSPVQQLHTTMTWRCSMKCLKVCNTVFYFGFIMEMPMAFH